MRLPLRSPVLALLIRWRSPVPAPLAGWRSPVPAVLVGWQAEEEQIFKLFGEKTYDGPHLDAHHGSACLCKVALAVQQVDNVDLPFNLNEKADRYMEQMSNVAVDCACRAIKVGSAARRAARVATASLPRRRC